MGGQAKGKKRNKTKRKDNSNGGPGLADLSTSERVKLRMHEKAKKKTAERYSVQQLLEKTEECMDSFDFEMASRFCQRALDVEPTHLQMSPNEGHSKYMYLGQIHTGQEAVGYYTKGIEILQSVLEKEPPTTALDGACMPSEEDAEKPTARDVCVAYCSVAEIYLTDLCAEKNQEGKDYLMRSVGAWLPDFKRAEASLDLADEQIQKAIPPYESRITTAKLLIETEEFETAVDVLEGLLEEDDEVVQMEKAREQRAQEAREVTPAEQEECDALIEAARSYLTRAKKLYSKLGCDDQPILEHTAQLLGELGGEVEGDEAQEDPEDFEPC
ncbi:hypothetical protein NHX12_001755, partial [Muraenolepis orangiensis]